MAKTNEEIIAEMQQVVNQMVLDDLEENPDCANEYFEVMVEVSVGSTFFSWIFNYGGKIRIVAPESVKSEFDKMLHKFD